MHNLLIVNVGSTSLKFKLFAFTNLADRDPAEVVAEGRLEGIGRPESRFKIIVRGAEDSGQTSFANYEAALKKILDNLSAAGVGISDLSAVGFKPVHAHDVPLEAAEMDEDVLGRMAEFNFVCPAHNPPVIAAVRSFRSMLPEVPMIGLFEPAFHRHLPPEAYMQSLPHDWNAKYGIRKYGFHGASHRYIAERTPEFLGRSAAGLRVVSCHLGGSSSLCAICDGRSIDTTMAFSAQSGVPQGTRCGHIDPFIPLFMMKEKGMSLDEIARVMAKESGLLGLSGVSAEFREIQEAADAGNERAKLAIDVYVYQVRQAIAQMTAPLAGIDALVFTGGIGERGAATRAAICEGLDYLGITLDPTANERAVGVEARIQIKNAPVQILVLPTDEEIIIARECLGWLGKTY